MTKTSPLRRLFAPLLAMSAAALLTACSGPVAPAAGGENGGTSGAVPRGGTLRIASLQSDLDALDPLTGYSTDSWQIIRALTRQLVTYPGSRTDIKDDTELVPDLAESWDVSDDGRTYTFHLRDNIRYSGSSTREIVAADFVYAIKRFCDPNKQVAAINYFELAFSGFSEYCEKFAKVPPGDPAKSKAFIDGHDISGVSAPDDKTLVLKSDTKNYDFLAILSMNFVSPLPEEVVSKYVGDSLEFRENYPSSGPYQIESYEPGRSLVLKKVPGYDHAGDPARKAYVDRIEVDFTANSEDAVVQKIQSGDADLSLYLDVPPLSTIQQYQARNSPNLHASDSGAANFITFNARPGVTSPGAEALRELKVRQALAYAVNKANLVQAQGGAIAAKPLGQIITSTILGHEPFDPYPTPGNAGDPAKARRLLAEAGHPDGLKLDAVYRVNAQFETIAVTLKEDLARAGIELNLIPVPVAQFSAYLQDPKSRWDVSLSSSFAPDWQGPSTRMLLGGWLNSDAAPCGTGNVHAICYDNPELNKLAAQAFSSDDPAPIWAKADKLVSADLPWIPLFEKRKVAITSDRVRNWTWSSLATQADITNIAVSPAD
ncbi:peptide/nickel transport system substrate-binding protein [Thermocatellispora tengchongensis]|uniref:Peptide/nickel transport system substrate-binding protein n=1 Tax=Thermocatellispora tengchongensis TaxID=1073253 RepID=A0A840P662_9ACTN|nr:ABC transporter substrate-binding protein [Thermocatellispora tengchongensis]MBB5133393.1 peptide/nickel transport system substrate-binding protein [Thermocatellispora tengchongensis]